MHRLLNAPLLIPFDAKVRQNDESACQAHYKAAVVDRPPPIVTFSTSIKANSMIPSGLKSVPRRMLPICEKIVAVTDDVCDRHLNQEYRELARVMTAALCRKRPSPLTSGQPRTWGASIVYALGRVNFLSDKSSYPHMTTVDLCAAFGVSESTVHSKVRVIEEALAIGPLDLRWTLPSLAEKNPLTWMAEVNGFLVDLRYVPREVQEIAFAKGMIPHIPTDKED
jgi:hypothetical protein